MHVCDNKCSKIESPTDIFAWQNFYIFLSLNGVGLSTRRKCKFSCKHVYTILQWKPLNVITLGPRETDNINRMITLTEYNSVVD